MKTSIEVLNKDAIKSVMAKTAQAKKNLQLIVRYSAMEVYTKARERCPVQTGNLRGSISIRYIEDGGNYGAKIFSNVVYAAEQEYNEHYNHNNPLQVNRSAEWGFFRKALADVEPEFLKRMSHFWGEKFE